MKRRRIEALERLFASEAAERGRTTVLTEEERINLLTGLYARFAWQNGFTEESPPDLIWQWAHEHAVRRMTLARASGVQEPCGHVPEPKTNAANNGERS
jgi:hypothetical protein